MGRTERPGSAIRHALLIAVATIAASLSGCSCDDESGATKKQPPACSAHPSNPACFQCAQSASGECDCFYPNYTSCAGSLPPDPAPLGRQVSFLTTGQPSLQADATGTSVSSKLDAVRVSVIAGTVNGPTGKAAKLSGLPGATVKVVSDPSLGQVETEWGSPDASVTPTGRFFIAVNAGVPVRLRFEKAGFLSAERVVDPVAGQYVKLDPVELVRLDSETSITPGAATWTVVAGLEETDSSGSRSARVFIPPGTNWTVGGAPFTRKVGVSVKEYTVGDAGVQRMPALLPPTSAYTYAVEFHATDTATGEEIHPSFTPPSGQQVVAYVDNFLKLPVGATVPSGHYDSERGVWTQHTDAAGAALNGKIVKVVGSDAQGGAALFDTDGDGNADNQGISLEERRHIAASVTTGAVLWRVPISHFSAFDFNWSFGLPSDALAALFGVDTNGVDGACKIGGSTIECETQILGEEIPVVGTPYSLVYRSGRTPGYGAARQARITVAKQAIPASATRIVFKASVAGTEHEEERDQPGSGWTDQVFDYTWSGKDAFGREPNGAQPVTYQVGLVYAGQYGPTAQFGLPSSAASYTANVTRQEITLWNVFRSTLGALDAKNLGFGGWTLSAQHFYAPASQTLYLGFGGELRSASLPQGIAQVADSLSVPRGLAFAPDGTLHVASSHNFAVPGTNPGGEIVKIVGGKKTSVVQDLLAPSAIAFAPDGSLYIAETGAHRILRVAPGKAPTAVVGTGKVGDGPDGPGAGVALSSPLGLAVGLDGAVFIADTGNNKVRRLATDGTVTTTINAKGAPGTEGDGGFATQAQLTYPVGLALDASGNLFVADNQTSRIRRVDPSGRIHLVAGGGSDGTSDGIPATTAELGQPRGLAVAPDGALYFAEEITRRIRKITHEGMVVTVAGAGGAQCSGDGGPARDARFLSPDGIVIGSDRALYVSDTGGCDTVRKIASPLPAVGLGGYAVPSADGSELYVFNEVGRHEKTLDAWSGQIRLRFEYTDYAGAKLLTGIAELGAASDAVGFVTTIDRDADGRPLGIRGAAGQGVSLGRDPQAWLSEVTTLGNGSKWKLGSDPSGNGLLVSFDQDVHHHSFAFDAAGRLTTDRDEKTQSGAPFRKLTRSAQGTGASVAVQTAQGLVTSYSNQRLPDGSSQRAIANADGTSVTAKLGVGGERTVTLADGAVLTSKPIADPRFGMASATFEQILDLGGKVLVVRSERTATDLSDAQAFGKLTETVRIRKDAADSGLAYEQTIDRAASPNVVRWVTPEQRKIAVTLDTSGRAAKVAPDSPSPEVAAIEFEYDSGSKGPGRVTRIKQANRSLRLDWDAKTDQLKSTAAGALGAETDLVTSYTWDLDGLLKQRKTAGTDTGFSWDPSFNLTALRPEGAGGPVHALAPEWFGALHSYDPPNVAGVPLDLTTYSHDTDHRPTAIAWPNGASVAASYNPPGAAGGTLHSLTFKGPSATAILSYDSLARPASITTNSGVATSFGYGAWGKLIDRVSTAWTSGAQKDVAWTYDDYLRISSESPTGGSSVAYQFDDDSLITHAIATSPPFDLDLSARSSQSGRLESISLGSLTTKVTYDPTYGDLTTLATGYSGSNLYTLDFTFDAVGRISTRADKVGAEAQSSVTYSYDADGRLIGADGHSYGYDARGNRTTVDSSTVAGYDAQDRITNFKSVTYQHDAAGRRTARVDGAQTTKYPYDAAGNLLSTTLPDGSSVTYTLDGFGRRVSRTSTGVEQRFLYAEGHRLVAVLDASGAVVQQFVYGTTPGSTRRGTRRHSPDVMIKGGVVYRILTDQLGSVRLVVNASTGATAQRIDYDAWGVVTGDTAPGFQPLGFAGGLYDADTKLVHFGAREYDPWKSPTGGDPEVGRWVTKDPSLFHGGVNLYAYANNDPIDLVDPDGRTPLLAVALISGTVSGTAALAANALGQKIAGRPVSWSNAAMAGGIGFAQGALVPGSRGAAAGIGAAANVATYLATTPTCC